MENRHGLVVDGDLTEASGTANIRETDTEWADRPGKFAVLLIFRINCGFQTYVPYVGRNSTFLAMNKLTNPQATNKRLAFLSSPR